MIASAQSYTSAVSALVLLLCLQLVAGFGRVRSLRAKPIFCRSKCTARHSQWNGEGLSQDDLMEKEFVLVVDTDDNIIDRKSKFEAHRFTTSKPAGALHRAFSVFLFDGKNRLLLQQRASHKITFPDVWTNTCCSHPLHGQNPSEVDDVEAVRTGQVPGIKQAAIRKLDHELGIPQTLLQATDLKYLTRIHYSAPCTPSGEGGSEREAKDFVSWGESEIDYVLFGRISESALKAMQPNPEEVGDTKLVSKEELAVMMKSSSGLSWSPWFYVIAESLLEKWWEDLDSVISTDRHVDYGTIHRL